MWEVDGSEELASPGDPKETLVSREDKAPQAPGGEGRSFQDKLGGVFCQVGEWPRGLDSLLTDSLTLWPPGA